MTVMSLGIKDLDKSLGGGFPYPCLASIEGDFGSGKTALTQQIVFSALKSGFRVCVVTSETTAKEYLGMMKSIKIDPFPYYVRAKLDVFALHVEGGKWNQFLSSLFFKVMTSFLEMNKK